MWEGAQSAGTHHTSGPESAAAGVTGHYAKHSRYDPSSPTWNVYLFTDWRMPARLQLALNRA